MVRNPERPSGLHTALRRRNHVLPIPSVRTHMEDGTSAIKTRNTNELVINATLHLPLGILIYLLRFSHGVIWAGPQHDVIQTILLIAIISVHDKQERTL